MNITITGGAGFLGTMLTETLLQCPATESIRVVDRIALNGQVAKDPRVMSIVADITCPETMDAIIDGKTTHVFHLAAIVSGHAEEDFDLGIEVNLTATQLLLEQCRRVNPAIRFVFSSSLAVFGGALPEQIEPMTATQPNSSYGTQKAMCELLTNDYGRKALVDAITVRLPTICIRPGPPNKAASSFVSALIREPLKGKPANCPVDKNLPLLISSPAMVITNMIHASQLDRVKITGFRVFNLPGIQVTPEKMLSTLVATAGAQRAVLVTYQPDPFIERIVASWPQRFNYDKELSLGFKADNDFQAVLDAYLNLYPV